MFIALTASAAIVLPFYMAGKFLRRNTRRKRLLLSPPPDDWVRMATRNVALYRRLPDDLKTEVHGHMQVLIAEKNFEGCGGLKMTDEIRVTIAAGAAMLILKRRTKYFPMVDSILVYPHPYYAEEHSQMGYGVVDEVVRLGESSVHGAVVLAWDQVRRDSADPQGRHNVVLHEFAHQLDQEDGRSDGVPVLHNLTGYDEWGKVLGKEYDLLRDKTAHYQMDVLDSYGATNPAEFFAVATEAFFCDGMALKDKHPALYRKLAGFYMVDPTEWTGHAA